MFKVTVLAVVVAIAFYIGLYYLLRKLFRQFEKDIALVALNVSAYPLGVVFVLGSIKFALYRSNLNLAWLNSGLIAGIILILGYWLWRLMIDVVFYDLKKWTENSEIMWDNVLLPLLEAVTPVVIALVSLGLILQLSFGVDLSGIWVTLGGASFIIGFATKDILANFFSGIVLLIDTPFQFGDVLRFETGELGILQRIGLRVTQIYQFETHTEAYIPNSVLQAQKIVNVSRPIAPIYYSVPIIFPARCDYQQCFEVMEKIILAHPDTIGDIDTKLKYLGQYFNWTRGTNHSLRQNKIAHNRLVAEQEVNAKLQEIEENLEALVLSLEIFEKDGLDSEEIETIKQDYQLVLELAGLEFTGITKEKKSWLSSRRGIKKIQLEETKDKNSLISLVRRWYRIRLKDKNIVDEDQYILPKIWEYQIELLKKRFTRLQGQILNPERIETRLDDYVNELVVWLKSGFKQARNRCHDPNVRLGTVFQGSTELFLKFSLNYYVDDIRLEDGKRGERVTSEIHREILNHLQHLMTDRIIDKIELDEDD